MLTIQLRVSKATVHGLKIISMMCFMCSDYSQTCTEMAADWAHGRRFELIVSALRSKVQICNADGKGSLLENKIADIDKTSSFAVGRPGQMVALTNI